MDQTHDAENNVHGDTSENAQRLMGIRSDIAEISGSVRTGLSRFSSNKAVHEISKLASNLLPFRRDSEGDDDEGEEEKSGVIDKRSFISAVGITEEVLTFARNISMHPETWLDFPLFNDEDDLDGKLSDIPLLALANASVSKVCWSFVSFLKFYCKFVSTFDTL